MRRLGLGTRVRWGSWGISVAGLVDVDIADAVVEA